VTGDIDEAMTIDATHIIGGKIAERGKREKRR